MSGSGISWAVCKSAPLSRQTTHQHPTTQLFTGRMPFLPPNQQRQSTEARQKNSQNEYCLHYIVYNRFVGIIHYTYTPWLRILLE